MCFSLHTCTYTHTHTHTHKHTHEHTLKHTHTAGGKTYGGKHKIQQRRTCEAKEYTTKKELAELNLDTSREMWMLPHLLSDKYLLHFEDTTTTNVLYSCLQGGGGGSLAVESFLQKRKTRCVVSCPCFCCRGSVHGQLRPQHQRFSVLPHHSQDRLVRMCQEQFVPSVTSFVITGRVIAHTACGTGVSKSILRMKRFEIQTPAWMVTHLSALLVLSHLMGH